MQESLVKSTHALFDLPLEDRLALHVKNGGVAWRGYMPHGGEGTHGRVDQKEGFYLGKQSYHYERLET